MAAVVGILLSFYEAIAEIYQSLFVASIAETRKLCFGGRTRRIKGNHTDEIACKRLAFAFAGFV